jgi:hypothetical protein
MAGIQTFSISAPGGSGSQGGEPVRQNIANFYFKRLGFATAFSDIQMVNASNRALKIS